MMYIKSFVTELTKKIETVELQLKEFESKMEKINSIKKILTLNTLKSIDELKGEDLALIEKDDFIKVLEILNFEDPDEKIKMFFNASLAIKVNQKIISDGETNIKQKKDLEKHVKWLEEQLEYIKEYIKDFNDNNKEYYNSLKISDNLYKKYLSNFKNNKLVKPIYNIEEFNELLKKSGIITSEKWQLLKYIGEKNLELGKKDSDEEIEYNDNEILSFAETILKKEESLIKKITPELVEESLNIINVKDEDISNLKLTEDDIVMYEKIPILNTLFKIYQETKELIKNEKDEDAKIIESNLEHILQLVDSYNIIKKIES